MREPITSCVVKGTAKEVYFMSKLKNIRTMTICAMLLALSVILGFLKIVVIPNVVEIRLSPLPIAMGGGLFGPVIGMVIGALSDIVGFIAKPTGAYFPGFTISSAVGGLIFGICLRNKKGKITLTRIIIAEILYAVIVGMFFNTLNLTILTHGDFKTLFFARLFKEVAMTPVNTLLLWIVIEPINVFYRKNLSQTSEIID